jgi:hypothetical protein
MRFKYEAPSFLHKAAISFKAPHRWRSGTRPWVFDNLSGIRFQLSQDEETVIRKLAAAMAKRQPGASLDAAFDYVASVIARKRLGYTFDWRRLSAWTAADWDTWLSATEIKAAEPRV